MTEYYNGMFGNLKHNILLMLSQIEGNIEHADKDDCEQLNKDLGFIKNRIKKIRDAIQEGEQ